MTERGELYKQLIDRLSEQASEFVEFNGQRLLNEKKSFECQLTLVSGAIMAGVLTKTNLVGVYSLRTVVRRGEAKSGPIDIVDQYFTAEDIVGIIVPQSKETKSGLVGANNREIVSLSSGV